MGKGKPRHKKRHVEEDDGSDSEISVEEGDIEALARQSLKAGETILGAGQTSDAVESRGICKAPLILQALEEIEYKVPANVKRVPWVDTLCIDGWKEVPKDVKAKDGVKLEQAFMDMAAEAASEAYRRFRVMKVPASRPSDFYAEMLRSDSQMFKVRERAAEEQRRIKIVEQRKQAQYAKKFQKASKVARLEGKAAEKNKTMDEIADWKARRKQDRGNADDQDLEDILDKQKGGKSRDDGDDGEGRKKKKKGLNKKRQAIDKKFGFGGKKKWAKSNTKESTGDMSASPWARQGKGKGKGKGGGKGKRRFRN